jgi:hypothetical protein
MVSCIPHDSANDSEMAIGASFPMARVAANSENARVNPLAPVNGIDLRIGSRTFGGKISIGDSPGAHPRSLRPAVAEAVEHIREKWSLEVVECDHAGNNG